MLVGTEDHGQGSRTIFAQMAAETLGVPLANAIHDAIGVRIKELSITQEKILGAMEEKK